MDRKFRSTWILLIGTLVFSSALPPLLTGCSKDDDFVLRPPDVIPPAVTQLAVSAATDTTVTFSWRAPGDDGMSSTASSYDLRYSAERFDDTNWDTALQVPGLPAPATPRSAETGTATGLIPGRSYFFALRTRDEVSNWSPISDVINLTVPAGEGYPILWDGKLLATDGTTQTAFIYQVRRRFVGQPDSLIPNVIIADSAYAMTLIAEEGSDAIYEFDVRLEPGSYDYRFQLTLAGDLTSQLPHPGSWDGPDVEARGYEGIAVVEVPAGSFTMGNPDPGSSSLERPARNVKLTQPVEMDTSPITNAQLCDAYNWALEQGMLTVAHDTLVTSTTGGAPLMTLASRREGVPHGVQYAAGSGFTPLPFREDWPATYVTWFGAAFYCNIRSLGDSLAVAYNLVNWDPKPDFRSPYASEGWRLPTEAEWEYAARYDDSRIYPTGNNPPVAGTDGNFAGVVGHPTPVGQYFAGVTTLGLHDMVGNVWEWCYDWKSQYTIADSLNPAGPLVDREFRVLRGGSWGSSVSELRCAFRFSMRPGSAHDGIGFRSVRSTPPAR